MSSFSAENIRGDFPILEHLIYLDNAATSLSPRQVVEAQVEAEFNYRANVGRGVHRLGRMATHKYENARSAVKSFFGGERGTLAFTRNTTESVNLVASGLDWKPSDRVIVLLQDHHSNLLPWFRLAEEKRIAGVDVVNAIDGEIRISDIEPLITDDTRMIAAGHASNVFGTVAPVEDIANICSAHDILFLIDGAQSAPHLPLSLDKLGCDYFCFSGHKMLGPMGIGGLWISEKSELPCPMYVGGGMVDVVSGQTFSAKSHAAQYEAGTPNVIGAIGLAEAAGYLANLGMENVARHSESLAKNMVKGLSSISGVNVYTPGSAKLIGTVSFSVEGIHPHEVAYFLDEAAGIMVRSGEHCCQPLMQKLVPGGGGTVRASAYCYNTDDDVDMLIATVEEIAGMVK